MPLADNTTLLRLQQELTTVKYRPQETGLATGYQALDQALPSKGWPTGAVTELLVPRLGSGEFRLLLPLLADITGRDQWIALVRPPWVPNPHALAAAQVDLRRLRLIRAKTSKDALWATDQLLRSGAFKAVVAWPEALPGASIRKLQLAAENGRCCGFLIRSDRHMRQHSMAPLRIHLKPRSFSEAEFLHNPYRLELQLQILKCRGLLHQRELTVEMNLLE